jgi:hypothetical protein
MPIVYKATNKVNGHHYVGMTRKTLVARRRRHESVAFSRNARDQAPRLCSALRKYGRGVFEWEVIGEFETAEEAIVAEAKAIAAQRPEYNVKEGGEFTPVGAGQNRISIICLDRGEIFPSMTVAAKEYGLCLSEVSAACRGDALSVKGLHFMVAERPMSLEDCAEAIRTKIATHVLQRSWRSRSVEWRQQEMRRRTNGNHDAVNPGNQYRGVEDGRDVKGRSAAGPIRLSRAVVCLDDGIVYPSASAAARAYGAARSAVIELCLGKNGRRTASGHRFSYQDY